MRRHYGKDDSAHSLIQNPDVATFFFFFFNQLDPLESGGEKRGAENAQSGVVWRGVGIGSP